MNTVIDTAAPSKAAKNQSKSKGSIELPAAAPAGTSGTDLLAAAQKVADEKEAARKRQLEIDAEVAAEVEGFTSAIAAAEEKARVIRSLGLRSLAIALGHSTSKSGRPGFAEWLAYVMAIAVQKPSFEVQNGLAILANKNVPDYSDTSKPVVVAKMKAKGEAGAGSCNYRINKPVAWDIAVSGE